MTDPSHRTVRSFLPLLLALLLSSMPAVVFVGVAFVELKHSGPPRGMWFQAVEYTQKVGREHGSILLKDVTNVTTLTTSSASNVTTLTTSFASSSTAAHFVGTIYVSSVYGWPPEGPISGCEVQCNIVRNASLWRSAEVVVWNFRWMTSNPLLMGANVNSKPWGQRWVANYFFEAPTKENPKLMTQLGPGIDWTVGFQTGTDFFTPIMRLVPTRNVSQLERSPTNYALGKDKLLLWFVSNCGAKARMDLFRGIESHLPANKVQRFGKCGGKKDPCGSRFNISCITESSRRFKFYAAFENTRCDGYITEKFSRGYEYGMVPIAWGGLSRADYEKLVPANSFIHVDDFRGVKALADYLLELDKDDIRYNRYFEWRKTFRLAGLFETRDNTTCQLCMEAHKPPRERRRSRSDWSKGFFGRCRNR